MLPASQHEYDAAYRHHQKRQHRQRTFCDSLHDLCGGAGSCGGSHRIVEPKLAEFACHYGTAILPCLPRTLEHKGTVENSVGYVKHNALAARVFDCLAAQNLFLSQ